MSSKKPSIAAQYLACKKHHQNELVFFQVGEFYEAMFDDAVELSSLLNLTLTKRGSFEQEDVKLCGIPRISRDSYILKLLKQNKKVAFYEQSNNNTDLGTYIQTRTLSRIFTPGTIIEEDLLLTSDNNFLIAVYQSSNYSNMLHLGILDISICQLTLKTIPVNDFETTLLQYPPSEILITLSESLQYTFLQDEYKDKLTIICSEYFNHASDDKQAPLKALEQYIKHTKCIGEFNLQIDKNDQTMHISKNSRANLEILHTTSGDKKGSLIHILNKTHTALGSRYLIKIINAPLIDLNIIEQRLDCIQFFLNFSTLQDNIEQQLKQICDIERTIYRILAGREKKTDYLKLLYALNCVQTICNNDQLSQLAILPKIPPSLTRLITTLTQNITDHPTHIINTAFNLDFAKLLHKKIELEQNITILERKYKLETGAQSLKIKTQTSNLHFIEINSKDHSKMNYHYQLIQTLANAKRYSCPELEQINCELATLNQMMIELEENILSTIKERIKENRLMLDIVCQFIARLDVFISLAKTAQTFKLSRPKFTNNICLKIIDGKHLALSHLQYVQENNCDLSDKRCLFLTGPNMSGKSTYMRQNAQIILLAQIGSFVPAKSAQMNICDAIYTRIGAYDDISKGKSTFMCEMEELSEILNNASDKSLIILDEIGRGTHPKEGHAIAQASLEYIINNINARTIFATHFTAIQIDTQKCLIKKMHSEFDGNKITHLHKLIDGLCDHSYGVITAKEAGISDKITARAQEIYTQLN